PAPRHGAGPGREPGRRRARDPAALATGGRDPPVQRRRELQGDERPAPERPHRVARREQASLPLAGTDDDRDPGAAESGDAPSSDARIRVRHRDDDPPEAEWQEGVDARRRPPEVRARLERHVEGRAARPVSPGAERHPPRMRPARAPGAAPADRPPPPPEHRPPRAAWAPPPAPPR